MKKAFMALAACALIASCPQKGKTEANAENADSVAVDSMVSDSVRYEGVVPAADGPGIRYELALANDSTDGFSLVMTYLEAENGKDKVFYYTGKKEDVKKTVDGAEKMAYKLNLGKKEDTEYFLVLNDSTLRMVNEDLKEGVAGGTKYDLKLKK